MSAPQTQPTPWRLKKGEAKRVSARHPWIFSNQLSHSPKGIERGSFVELTGDHNEFIAYGYGNPNSLISFRVLSWDVTERNLWRDEVLVERIVASWQRRLDLGFENSYRVVFSEVDQLPGLVVDRFQLQGFGAENDGTVVSRAGAESVKNSLACIGTIGEGNTPFRASTINEGNTASRAGAEKTYQVLAFQVLTAGMEKWLSNPKEVFQKVVEKMGGDWNKTFLVERKDTSIRKMEGLEVLEPRCLHAPAEIADSAAFLSEARVCTTGSSDSRLDHRLDHRSDHRSDAGSDKGSDHRLDAGSDHRLAADSDSGSAEPLILFADLLKGQTTGFFLDQSLNMQLVQWLLKRRADKLRILDLCCYVGHWSLQLAAGLKVKPEISLVDVSASSLERASKTMKNAGLEFETHEVDVLKDMQKWPEGPFDVLIVDPPAFAKSRKDLPMAEHAYIKLNAEAFRRAAPGALVISCSCSGLVSEELFSECLAKALRKSGREGSWLLRGGQGLDHPVSPHFPEGRYLKMFVTQVR